MRLDSPNVSLRVFTTKDLFAKGLSSVGRLFVYRAKFSYDMLLVASIKTLNFCHIRVEGPKLVVSTITVTKGRQTIAATKTI